MKAQFVLFILLIFIAFTNPAFGCLQTETGVPACAYWTRADVVFSGKVLKIENAAKSEDLPAGARKIRFQVLQNFKGADNPTFSLVTADAKTGGGLEIKKGETWIIYAANDIVVKAFTAFRGIKIEPKIPNDELETLKSVAGGKTEAAISGRIVSDVLNGKYEYEPVEITVENRGKRLVAQTDADGAFNIPVPSEGIYKVEMKLPYRASLKWNEMLLGAFNTEGIPTIFKYEVRLNDGDCNYSFFEVLKK
ncbi:MAG TPA: hypothetical protein VNB22_04655 [Pyrinomonadaceae bacterium]|nr:hypothetical protein [Pyrinomonadaceae bacterium]